MKKDYYHYSQFFILGFCIFISVYAYFFEHNSWALLAAAWISISASRYFRIRKLEAKLKTHSWLSNIAKELNIAFELGRWAYEDGFIKSNNPFCKETEKAYFTQWENGWLQGYSKSDDIES